MAVNLGGSLSAAFGVLGLAPLLEIKICLNLTTRTLTIDIAAQPKAQQGEVQ